MNQPAMTATSMTTEREDEVALTWAMCKVAGGGGQGKCDAEHCVCAGEARGVIKALGEKGFIVASAQPPQPTGDVEGLGEGERQRIKWLRSAGVGSSLITTELLAIIDRLNSRLADLTKKYAGSFTHDEYHAGCNAIRNERHRAEARAEKAEAALVALHTLLDFEEPVSDEKPWIFWDCSPINAAFADAYAVVSALSTGAGGKDA